MKVIKYLFLAGLITLVLSKCDHLTDPTEVQEIPVVEGYLYSDGTSELIQLSLMIPLSSTDTIPEPINNAEVVVSYEGQPYLFALAPGDSGLYRYSGNDLVINPGGTYELEVNYNNNQITSKTSVPPQPNRVQVSDDILYIDSDQPPFEIIRNLPEPQVTWNNPEENYHFIVVENLEENPIPIINAENAPGFNGGLFAGNLSFRTTPTNSDFYTIDLRGGFYGRHKVTVYSVNKDYVSLYEEREQDSRQLNEPPTNITNGLGIFTSFSSDSTFFWILEN
ncbi:DUF4249 family protein [Balneolaceae bacterium YR4-1]|uniref:DUF4249 family protein n=1 Tax=Halalkalibaculum roseum TaxID=2709311 RepID=A0A6M1SSQ6_9BACT|nr:DUF4249 family protein [Halalkalibaculum roseum]NGP75128.1 DUF4249 family protein [Halalkalibaculum roseum]